MPPDDLPRSVFTVEVDLTARAAGSYLPALLTAVVDVDQLTEYTILTRVAGRLAYVPGIRGLSEEGITGALADPASAKVDPARALLVVEVPEALLAAPAWTGPVLALGAATRRPAVVRTPEGVESVAIRTIAHLTLAVDPFLPDATAFLTAVAARLSREG